MLCPKGMGCAKVLIPWDAGVGQGEKWGSNRPERSLWQLLSNDMRSNECGPKLRSTKPQASSDSMQSSSEHTRVGTFAGLLREGTKGTLIAKFNWRLHCKVSLTDSLTEELWQPKSSKAVLRVRLSVWTSTLESRIWSLKARRECRKALASRELMSS